MVKANNYPVALYKEGEVEIQTNSKQLEATGGKVYLTVLELQNMLKLAKAKPSNNGGDYVEDWSCVRCKTITSHDIYVEGRKRKCNRCGLEVKTS